MLAPVHPKKISSISNCWCKFKLIHLCGSSLKWVNRVWNLLKFLIFDPLALACKQNLETLECIKLAHCRAHSFHLRDFVSKTNFWKVFSNIHSFWTIFEYLSSQLLHNVVQMTWNFYRSCIYPSCKIYMTPKRMNYFLRP